MNFELFQYKELILKVLYWLANVESTLKYQPPNQENHSNIY